MNDVDIRIPMRNPYNELLVAENIEGTRRDGGVLVEFVWREGSKITEDFEKTKDDLIALVSNIDSTHFMAKGILVYFDVVNTVDQGTTTFAELFVDKDRKTARLIIYSLRTTDMVKISYKNFDDLRIKLNWYDRHTKTLNDDGITQLSSIMYKKQTDG